MNLQELNQDKNLSSDQLNDKYNPNGDGEHPHFTRLKWRTAVLSNETIYGYWIWVAYAIYQVFSKD